MINKIKAAFESWIRKQYKRLRMKENIILATKAIKVKKGRIRYTLVVVETASEKMIFNIGRHNVLNQVLQFKI